MTPPAHSSMRNTPWFEDRRLTPAERWLLAVVLVSDLAIVVTVTLVLVLR